MALKTIEVNLNFKEFFIFGPHFSKADGLCRAAPLTGKQAVEPA
jgi:hypothetical protein